MKTFAALGVKKEYWTSAQRLRPSAYRDSTHYMHSNRLRAAAHMLMELLRRFGSRGRILRGRGTTP